jgi:hypothetical protein
MQPDLRQIFLRALQLGYHHAHSVSRLVAMRVITGKTSAPAAVIIRAVSGVEDGRVS